MVALMIPPITTVVDAISKERHRPNRSGDRKLNPEVSEIKNRDGDHRLAESCWHGWGASDDSLTFHRQNHSPDNNEGAAGPLMPRQAFVQNYGRERDGEDHAQLVDRRNA